MKYTFATIVLIFIICMNSFSITGDENGLSALPEDARTAVLSALNRDRSFQVAMLTASDGAPNSDFGLSVAMTSTTIVVGAPASNSFEGAVYVFVKPASGWINATQTAKLTASDGASGWEVGNSVAIAGNTIVTGATGANGSQGAVYVYVKPAGGWANGTETAKLTASDAAGGRLGGAISINGTTIVAGAPAAAIGNNQAQGSAYVFVEPAGGWVSGTQNAKLIASDGKSNDAFSSGVSVSGNTIAVGAWEYTSQGNGAAYVYTKPASGWSGTLTQTAKLTASDGLVDDILGISIAISGNTIVAGAPNKMVGTNKFAGALYVFVEPKTGWVNATQTAELTASNGVFDASLGDSVAFSGNIILGGAPFQMDGNNFGQGAVYAYVKPPSGWANSTEIAELTANNGASGDELGYSTAIGAPYAASGALGYKSYTGAVYVFQK